MARGAGARPATFGHDAGHLVVDGTFHDGAALRHIVLMASARRVDVGDLRHVERVGKPGLAGLRSANALQRAFQLFEAFLFALDELDPLARRLRAALVLGGRAGRSLLSL